MTTAAAWDEEAPPQLSIAMAGSLLLHAILVVALSPLELPEEKRFSYHAVEVTLERATAPSASPAAPAMPAAGTNHPPGSTDLVHTALASGPPDASSPLVAAPTEQPGVRRSPPGPHPEPTLEDKVLLSETPPVVAAGDFALGAPSFATRSPDPSDRIQAPPPTRRVARQTSDHASNPVSRRNPIMPSATATSAEKRRQADTASYASQHQARQDYVLHVVHKLSQARFSAPAEPVSNGRSVVVARLTVARDGGLVDLSLIKGSGSAGIDTAILGALRKAAPFAPLPRDFTDSRFTFIVPIDYAPVR